MKNHDNHRKKSNRRRHETETRSRPQVKDLSLSASMEFFTGVNHWRIKEADRELHCGNCKVSSPRMASVLQTMRRARARHATQQLLTKDK
jgi:hypothetical protein